MKLCLCNSSIEILLGLGRDKFKTLKMYKSTNHLFFLVGNQLGFIITDIFFCRSSHGYLGLGKLLLTLFLSLKD